MDPNSQTPAPAAPAAPAPSEPAAPAAAPAPAVEPVAPAAPAARTQDPVDHSQPVEPVAPAEPAAPAEPVADPDDPNNDAPAEPAAVEPDAAALAGEVEDDPLDQQIKDAEARDGQLPSGVNPDGTINPLVYAYENMPEIKVQGKEGVKGEVKEYTIKTAEDLPADFRFANDVERVKFSSALQQNMNIANELIQEANGHNEQRIAANQQREVLVAQKTEVDQLIAAGKLPAMSLKPTDPNFMQDPGAIRAQQVLDHMKQVNADNAKNGINQKITSVALGLQLLEAKEAIEAQGARMGKITDTRNDISGKISGGGTAPAAPASNPQVIHKDVQSAIRAARRKHGI